MENVSEAFKYVRPACDFASVLSTEAAVSVVDGWMQAFSSSLIVSQPCDLPDFAVPAVDFDFAMRKHEEPEIKVTDKNVILDGKTRVKRLVVGRQIAKPDIETVKIADVEDLVGAVTEVFAFTDPNPARPWAEGARFDGKKITATNSIMLCQAELKEHSGMEQVTISRAALSYIMLRGEQLVAWGISERGLLMEFEDGAWALASRLSMEMPESAALLVNSIADWDNMHKVTEDYRAAMLVAVDWAEDFVTIHPDKISSGKFTTSHEEFVESKVFSPALFNAKELGVVISCAKEIGFDRFPSPAPFITLRGSRGLLAGRVQ